MFKFLAKLRLTIVFYKKNYIHKYKEKNGKIDKTIIKSIFQCI